MNVAVLGHHQRGAHLAGQVRFEPKGLIGVDERMRNVGGHKRTPLFVQVVDLGIVNGDLKGPVPAVLDGPAGVAGHSRHEAVVLFQTADAQPQERARVSFDIWSQNAGGCACRTLPASALINDAHLSAARRQLVRDRIADYAGADDDDLHRTILVGSWYVEAART
jgi:hypothetical protein